MASTAFQNLSTCIVKHTGIKKSASVIMLHGSGGSGSDLKDTFKLLLRRELSFPHISLLYPTAPLRPYSLIGGMPSNVWFDRTDLGLEAHECQESIDAMAFQIGNLIEAEVKSGIPLNRIIVGGFSMGACMSLHLGYRFHQQLAGIIAISTFLEANSVVYKDLTKRPQGSILPPLLQFHGHEDDLVRFAWGENTFRRLNGLNVQGKFIPLPHLGHSMNRTIAHSVQEWIGNILPEAEN